MRPTRLLSHLAITAALAGCPQRTAVWLAPTARADSLTFIFGERVGREQDVQAGYFVVARCQDQYPDNPKGPTKVWVLSAFNPEAGYATRITYGVVPPGYTVQAPALPLTPGCYEAATLGGQLRFWVDSLGGVRPDSTAR